MLIFCCVVKVYFIAVGQQIIVISVYVCLSVCMHACISQEANAQTLQKKNYVHCLWPWLSHSMVALQYIMTSGLWMMSHLHIMVSWS